MSVNLDEILKTNSGGRAEESHVYSWELAEVRYNADPLGLGRCRVRVPRMHGIWRDPTNIGGEEGVPDHRLPWARRVVAVTGGSPPPLTVGTMVYVVFEGGDQTKPVIVGIIPGAGANAKDYVADDQSPDNPIDDPSMGRVTVMAGTSDQPPEAQHIAANDPTVTATKTMKGAGLVIDDRDGAEYLSLLDRSGGGIYMESHVTRGKNRANASQRRDRSFMRGNQTGPGDTVSRRSRHQFGDSAGQLLLMEGVQDDTHTQLVSKSGKGLAVRGSYGLLELAQGVNEVTLGLVKSGEVVAQLVLSEHGLEITTGEFLDIRADTGRIKISRLEIEGDVEVDGTLTVNEDLDVGGRITGKVQE